MPTQFVFRLVVVCPAARLAALGAWWSANVDGADDLTTWPSLNASGDPAQAETHRWCSVALTDALLRGVIVRVCQLAAVTPPTAGTWNGWTRAQKKSWLTATRSQLFTNTGIWLDLSDNDGAWTDPGAVLAALSLKRRQATRP